MLGATAAGQSAVNWRMSSDSVRGEGGGRGPLVLAPAKGRVGGMRAARQRPTALRRSLLAPQIAQADHATPKLGLERKAGDVNR
jgi:hypothetical protein